MRFLTVVLTAFAFGLCVGCKQDAATGADNGSSPQCANPDGYIAFDVADYQAQDVRLSVYDDILALMDSAVAKDGSVDGSYFDKAKVLYKNATKSADLRSKVLERLDEHVAGSPLQGERLDSTLLSFFDFGAAATTAREAQVAATWVRFTLVEFFFLSVHHEMEDPTREHWDEALGYFGSHSDNDEANVQGLAQLATERDAANNTDLRAEIFNDFIDGACILDEALMKADVETLPLSKIPELGDTVDNIDLNLQKVLAFTAGHDAIEVRDLLEAGGMDVDGLMVEATELVTLFIPLERIMNDRGGKSAQRATQLRQLIDMLPMANGTPDASALQDQAWFENFDPTQIVILLEAEYDISIKG